MADTFLERIVALTRLDLAERMARVPLADVRDQALVAAPPRATARALRPARGAPARLIAEVKRASPSKGVLREAFDPVAQARAYVAGGAAAISVLTEPHFFLGSLEHMQAVRDAVEVPIIRKDFVLDPYQVYEARAAGADAVLLLCSLLDDAALAALLDLTHRLGMAALVEAHDEAEVRRAVSSGAPIIGVNCRDLRTFRVDADVVPHLAPLVPTERILVAENGIAQAMDAARARAWGAEAILVGEALMRAVDPAASADAFAHAGGGGMAALFAGRPHPLVKLCGLREPEHARVAVEAGADAFGLIFAPGRRQVSPEQGAALVRAAREVTTPAQQDDAAVPLAVGVFVAEAIGDIAHIAGQVGLDVVQLSGDESPAACAAVARATGLPVLKAVRLSAADGLEAADAYRAAGATILV